MADNDPVDWDEVKRAKELYSAADPFIRTWIDNQNDRWNDLIFQLSKLAKEGEPYEGETSDELLELIEKRLRKG